MRRKWFTLGVLVGASTTLAAVIHLWDYGVKAGAVTVKDPTKPVEPIAGWD